MSGAILQKPSTAGTATVKTRISPRPSSYTESTPYEFLVLMRKTGRLLSPLWESTWPETTIGILTDIDATQRAMPFIAAELTERSMFSISVSPCVATSLTVRWLAHAPQPIAKHVYSATFFLSSLYAGTKVSSSQSAPSVSRPSATWSPGWQWVLTS